MSTINRIVSNIEKLKVPPAKVRETLCYSLSLVVSTSIACGPWFYSWKIYDQVGWVFTIVRRCN